MRWPQITAIVLLDGGTGVSRRIDARGGVSSCSKDSVPIAGRIATYGFLCLENAEIARTTTLYPQEWMNF
jgi:hypothetical protein